MQILTQPFGFFGFEGQNWMLIVFFLVVAFIFFVRRTRDGFDWN